MATGSGLKGVQGEMAGDTNTRTADKQRQLENDYGNKLHGLLVDLEEATEEAEDQITHDRNTHLASLRELIKEKICIEQQILDHTAQAGRAYEGMKVELMTVIAARVEEYDEAEGMPKAAAQNDEEEDAVGDNQSKNGHNTGTARKLGHGQDGSANGDETQHPKKKVRKVEGKAHGPHADGDRATADQQEIISGVPGKEQVNRAEALAKQGRRP